MTRFLTLFNGSVEQLLCRFQSPHRGAPGNAYRNGQGVTQDDVQAATWYQMAAMTGYSSAEFNLGAAYHNGQGVTQNDAQAYFWIALAASGKVEGIKQEDFDKWRDDAASRLTPEELSQVRERVRKWLEDHPPKVE